MRAGVADLALLNHTDGVGFDPTRQRQKSPFDYVFVGAAIFVAIALVAWAILS
jgi:hypothetical protein